MDRGLSPFSCNLMVMVNGRKVTHFEGDGKFVYTMFLLLRHVLIVVFSTTILSLDPLVTNESQIFLGGFVFTILIYVIIEKKHYAVDRPFRSTALDRRNLTILFLGIN